MSPSEDTLNNVHFHDGWHFKFETKEYAYFKSKTTKQMDESFGDLKNKISAIEIEILINL